MFERYAGWVALFAIIAGLALVVEKGVNGADLLGWVLLFVAGWGVGIESVRGRYVP